VLGEQSISEDKEKVKVKFLDFVKKSQNSKNKIIYASEICLTTVKKSSILTTITIGVI